MHKVIFSSINFRILANLIILFVLVSLMRCANLEKESIDIPTVATKPTSVITSSSVICGGNVINDGGAKVSERGICWNTSTGPTIEMNKTVDGDGIGEFSSKIVGLTSNTKYFIRAYASNSKGTAYGNEVIFKTELVSIGESFQGGIVAYILKPDDQGFIEGETHGLIVAPFDQGTNIKWDKGENIKTGASGVNVGTGISNTSIIVSIIGSGEYASKLCYDLTLNGYSDWYLPSLGEFSKIKINIDALGTFATIPYWCSTEFDRNYAYSITLYSQMTGYSPKIQPLWVRAIRSF